MKIRRITPSDDAAHAGDLVQQAYFTLPGYERDPDYDVTLADVTGRDGEAEVIVAELDGTLVACLTFVPGIGHEHFEFDDPEACSFRYFGVDPAVQGRGVGEAMVRWCIDEGRRRGRRRLRIHTLTSMIGAQQLYAKLGFRRTPEFDEDWGGIIGLAFVLELDRLGGGESGGRST